MQAISLASARAILGAVFAALIKNMRFFLNIKKGGGRGSKVFSENGRDWLQFMLNKRDSAVFLYDVHSPCSRTQSEHSQMSTFVKKDYKKEIFFSHTNCNFFQMGQEEEMKSSTST